MTVIPAVTRAYCSSTMPSLTVCAAQPKNGMTHPRPRGCRSEVFFPFDQFIHAGSAWSQQHLPNKSDALFTFRSTRALPSRDI
jgi:hypothetical protein